MWGKPSSRQEVKMCLLFGSLRKNEEVEVAELERR